MCLVPVSVLFWTFPLPQFSTGVPLGDKMCASMNQDICSSFQFSPGCAFLLFCNPGYCLLDKGFCQCKRNWLCLHGLWFYNLSSNSLEVCLNGDKKNNAQVTVPCEEDITSCLEQELPECYLNPLTMVSFCDALEHKISLPFLEEFLPLQIICWRHIPSLLVMGF